MESFKVDGKISGKLAMENFREKARSIWEAIKRILKDIWTKIEAFFYKIFGTIPRRRKSLKDLLDRVEAASGKTRDQAKFTVAGNRYMHAGAKAIKSEGDLESGVSDFIKTAEWVYGGYVDSIKSAGDHIASSLEGFDPEKAADATEKLASDLGKVGSNPPGGSNGGGGGSRWPKYDVFKGHDLLGGVSLFGLRVKKGSSDAEAGSLAFLDRARQAQVVLEPSTEKANGSSTSIEFQTLSLNGAEKLIKQLDGLLDTMEKYQRGKGKGEIQKTKSKIESASNKAESAAGKLKESDNTSEQEAAKHYRALLNFNIAYARWVQTPTVPFTSLAFGVINTTITLIERSLAQYK
jgi:hypothetical protein